MEIASAVPHITYRPSGKVRWGRFLVGAATAFAVAAGLGWLTTWMIRPDMDSSYPKLAGLGIPISAVVFATIAWSHCRSPRLAGILGLVAALSLLPAEAFLGDWQADWLLFLIQAALAATLSMVVGISRAGRAYCENTQQWMVREPAKFTRGLGPLMAEAVEIGRLKELLDALAPLHVAADDYCELLVEYAPRTARITDAEDAESLVYLTITEMTVVNPRKPQQRQATEVARQWQLTEEEIAALVPKFPALANRQTKAGGSAKLPRRAASATAPAAEGAAAVWPVPPPYGGQVLTLGNQLVGSFVIGIGTQILSVGLGLAIMLLAMMLMGDPDLWKIMLMLLFLLGWLLGWLWLLTRYTHFFTDRFWHRLARRKFRERPDLLVDPEDPDALFVEVIPRRNWNRLMIDSADDIGFLSVDPRRGFILFEGDKERYRIPKAAVISCDVEAIPVGEGNAGISDHYMVVLRARVGDALWEAPLARRHIEPIPMDGNERIARAWRLGALLQSACPRLGKPDTTSQPA
jgi:hypothetical protein